MSLVSLQKELKKLSDPARAKASSWFFKTEPGQYGYGDVFLGIKVPEQRKIAHKYLSLPLSDISKLLRTNIHEHRFTALEILVAQFEQGDAKLQKKIYEFYLKNTKWINNWDLVDTSAPYIVGSYLLNKSRIVLLKLAKSRNLWERRIAIVSTFYFIAKSQLNDSLKIAEMLLSDSHDLIHKAVGWMLREVGKKDEKVLETFLKKNYKKLPRTTLRYAIERFPNKKRKAYLLGKI